MSFEDHVTEDSQGGRWPLDWHGLYPRERWLWFEQLWVDVCMLRDRYRLAVRAEWWRDSIQVEALAALAAWVERYDCGEWDDPPGKLALIYDDKMNDPLNALHHFKRFLTLAPSGKRAEEVKNFMKRDELALLTNLSGDSVVPRAEAVRLRNENLNLRKQIEERWAQNKAASAAEKAVVRAKPNQPNDEIAKTSSKARSYTVQPGDTLASISRKFYKTSSRWGKILDANAGSLSKPSDLKPGQKLTIP